MRRNDSGKNQTSFCVYITDLAKLNFTYFVSFSHCPILDLPSYDLLDEKVYVESRYCISFHFFPKRQNLDSSLQMTVLNLIKMVEVHVKGRNHCGKRNNCLFCAISPFLTHCSKDLYCRHVKTQAWFEKG